MRILKLVMAAPVATLLLGAPVYGDILFDTGPNETVLFNGTETNLGWTSGDAGPTQPQRWTAQPFTLADGQYNLSSFAPSFFVPADDPTELAWKIWSRNGTDAPTEADEIASGSVAYSGDPANAIGMDVDLAGGDYYITVYGVGNTIAWFTNAPNAIPFLDGNGDPWMWRSESYPDPGFLMYQLDSSVLAPVDGEDGTHLYATSFVLEGTAVPSPAALALLGLAGLARRRRR